MAASIWGITPRESVEAECARRGRREVAAGCARLLAGGPADDGLVIALGGPAARRVLDGLDKPYWLRVWAARGLLWAWDDLAAAELIDALGDEAWRVREMAAKVVARHLVGDALPVVAALAALDGDPVPRARAAAARAVTALTAARA